MNDLIVFNNAEFGNIRTVIINSEPWFVGKDIAEALGYGKGKSLNNAVANHVDDEDKGVTEMMTPGGIQNLIIINESGLYSLILSSKLLSAKKFKRWVTNEVLPSIRKTGHYGNTPLKDVISLIRITKDNMEKQGATPTQIAETINGICEQYGIVLPNFVIQLERVTMKNMFDMIDYVFSQPRGRGHRTLTYDDYIAHKASVKMIGGE